MSETIQIKDQMTDPVKVQTEEVKQEVIEKLPATQLHNVTQGTMFTDTLDKAKVATVQEAAASDEKFQKDFRDQLKEAAIKSAQLEREKQELEKQNVKYASELLETRQELNKQKQAEDKWSNRQKCREYHYKGVQPVMEFVGIKTPMNLFFLYLLTIILLPFFLLGKLIRGTFGALIAGACDSDRPTAVKGALWTIVFIVVLAVVGLLITLALGWMGIIPLPLFA